MHTDNMSVETKDTSKLRVRRYRFLKNELCKYESFFSRLSQEDEEYTLSSAQGSGVYNFDQDNSGTNQDAYEAEMNDYVMESNEDECLTADEVSYEDTSASTLITKNIRTIIKHDTVNINNEVDELRSWSLDFNIEQKALDKLLLILKKRLLPQLPSCSKTFLQTKFDYQIERNFNEKGEEVGQFVYNGIEEGIRLCINTDLHKNKELQLQFNIDGLPLFKSARKQFWPILCKIFSCKIDVYKPFVVAIFCGDSKPSNTHFFLDKFVTDLTNIMSSGLIINNDVFKVKLHCFICDTPARSFLKMTKGHGGFSACERCLVYGKRCEKRTIYDNTTSEVRTDASFRQQTDPEHHNGYSPLTNIVPKINMISNFVLDSMHLCSGVMKKLIEFWTITTGKARISLKNRLELTRRMLYIKNDTPFEFNRKPRSTADVKMWKATEFRFFLLYCGPIVLKKLLHKNYYKHFLLLHTAFRLLFSECYASQNNISKIYLLRFFEALPELYGEKSQILNMHNLIHVADDVEYLDCNLSYINCFPFENYLGLLKKCIRKADKPLAQVCRRLNEKKKYDAPSIPPFVEILNEKKILKNYKKNKTLLSQIKISGKFIISYTHPNNMVLLENNRIFKIKQIFYREDSEQIKIKGFRVKKTKNVYEYPTNSTNLHICEILQFYSKVETYPINIIKQKFIILSSNFVECEPEKMFILPLLHQ